jgi:hypothetical protein
MGIYRVITNNSRCFKYLFYKIKTAHKMKLIILEGEVQKYLAACGRSGAIQ